eukprot:2602743-Pyramimonas_sp.AAC.1
MHCGTGGGRAAGLARPILGLEQALWPASSLPARSGVGLCCGNNNQEAVRRRRPLPAAQLPPPAAPDCAPDQPDIAGAAPGLGLLWEHARTSGDRGQVRHV